MAEGPAAPKHSVLAGAKAWFARHEQTLLIVNCVSIALLFLLHIFGSTVPVFAPALGTLVNVFAIVLVSFIFASVVWKGVVPAVICMLGIVLMHNAIILPYYPPADPTFPDFMIRGQDYVRSSAQVSAQVASTMHFFLGLGMVAFAITLAYRPGFLFTRNRPRPEEEDDPWSKYPVWYDNIKLVGDHKEQMVEAKSLMEDADRYLIWRYEYVLAYIYGTAHLVRPNGLVPKKDTTFVRDEESGLLVGKARYTGYFT
ncbi:hypothetical protein [Nitrososphaera viennensis]|uniref:Uncharacterized protein n=2 Tax=Nitrososphaera viennensis TaxID=1034015 RepID=A0A060HJ27_9ARCH|nr:hypothetical protein [Nitrososphaera viennensis]AIC15305.1 hypothetical protein NVIE_1096 [Nitrososphaera viennensis EN76]UVS70207.1 hypothetical protein NWT39_05320 [Nitrososphaera viennensis]